VCVFGAAAWVLVGAAMGARGDTEDGIRKKGWRGESGGLGEWREPSRRRVGRDGEGGGQPSERMTRASLCRLDLPHPGLLFW